jgi:Na+/H+ antiporter NhaB
MKKFFKFLCGVASMAAVAFGAYCVYKNVIAKKDDEDFDDFDDCFEDEDTDTAEENREYVSINITEEVTDTAEEAEEDFSDAEENTEEEITE